VNDMADGGLGREARRTAVGSVMRAVPTCAADLPRGGLEELLPGHGEVVVLDPDGRPVGVVGFADLGRQGVTAGALFHPLALALDRNVPLSVAAAVMAHDCVDRIAIVGEGRRFLGLLTCRDVLGWLAREAGHR